MPTIEVFEISRKPIAASAESPSHLYARQQFDAGLQWLESRGVRIERHAISPHGTFSTDNAAVKTAVELQGADPLPIVVLDGTIITISGYPSARNPWPQRGVHHQAIQVLSERRRSRRRG